MDSPVARLRANVRSRILRDFAYTFGGNAVSFDGCSSDGPFDDGKYPAVWSAPLETRTFNSMIRSRCPFFTPAVAILLVAAALLSCNSKTNNEDDFRLEIQALERKISPPEAKIIARSGPIKNNWGVTASWDLETTMGTAEYSKWVTSQLQPEFKIARANESDLLFSKSADTDVHSVECKLAQTKDKLSVHVAFISSPD